MSKRVSREASGLTNRPQTVALDASRRVVSRNAGEGEAKQPTADPIGPPSPAKVLSSPKRLSAPGMGGDLPRAKTAMSMSLSYKVGGETGAVGEGGGMRQSMPELRGSPGGRAREGGRSASAMGGETRGRNLYGRQDQQVWSQELQSIQKVLHERQGKRFGDVQQVWHDKSSDWLASQEEKKEGEFLSSADKVQMKEAIQQGLQIEPSNEVIDEVFKVCAKKKVDGSSPSRVTYKDFAKAMWSNEIIEEQKPKPMEAAFKATADLRPPRHLFLPLAASGFYNDNIAPKATVFGVKKGYSSVRYDVFSNGPKDRSTLLSQVPPAVVKAVETSLGLGRLPSRHQVTLRPLDPYLSYLSVGQGRKNVQPRPNPLNVLTQHPRTDIPLSREWQSLTGFSVGFTQIHSGKAGGLIRNRVC